MSDKKISDLPLASAINLTDTSVLISNGTDYKFAFTALLQLIGSNLTVGANILFGTILPQNNTAHNGDIFINTSSGSFAQKIADTWTVVYTLPSSNGSTDGTVLYGLGIPGTSTGNNNDTYINTGTGIFYKKAGGTWGQVFSMQTGPAGVPGSAGANGTNGTNGFTVLNGTTTPSNLSTGVNGDFYINTTNYTLFGPKKTGNWGIGVSLIGGIGLTGNTGPAGSTGTAGPTGVTGHGVPPGGTSSQRLAKASSTDYDTHWVNNGFADLTGAHTDNTALGIALTTLQTNINTKQDTLGFVTENAANKNVANGYAGLDSNGLLNANQWPAGIDKVEEFANLTSFPTTGAFNLIYLALNTSRQYRWSGSMYIPIVATPGTTDAVVEGTTNFYFTVARVLATLLAGISFGTISAVTATDSILTAFGKLQAQITSIYVGLITGSITVAGGGGINVTSGTSSLYISPDGIKVNAGTSGTTNFTSLDILKIWFNNLTGGWQQIVPFSGTLTGNLIAMLPNKSGTKTIAMTEDLPNAPLIAISGVSGTNTYTGAAGLGSYYYGLNIFASFTNANTGACTLNVNSLGAINIKKPGAGGTVDLSAGDIQAGQSYLLFYDGTEFIVTGGLLPGSCGGSTSKISYNFYQSIL
jgi:hypothetical protein